MIAVIIAGGSGTRLWPLSTADYPKHLLRLTNERSLLQNTYDRVEPLATNIFVVPEKSHAKYIYQQLPHLPRRNILVEPARRGTASCFLLALSEIRRRHLGNEAIFFLWADHLVRNRSAFSAAIRQFAKTAESEQKLIFMGGEPTYPATGFNYIRKGKKLKNGHKNIYKLGEFVEKPNKVTAEKYFLSGEYLWNSGYLLGTLETFEKEIRHNAPTLWQNYQKLLEQTLLKAFSFKKTYMELPNEVIDDALSQKVKDALVATTPFDWADVGSFHDLHGASAQDGEGNHLIGEKVELEHVSNSYVRNEQNLPVAIIGLNNVAVVATDNGILVTDKKHAQKVGDISKRIQADRENLKWYEKL